MLVTRSLVRNLAVMLALALGASAQALVHYGAAATTGAAAGTAAGKKLSDALTNTMNAAEKAAKQGEAPKPAEAPTVPTETRAAAPLDGGAAQMPASPGPNAGPSARPANREAMLAAVTPRAVGEFEPGTRKRSRRIAAPVETVVEPAAPAPPADPYAGMPYTMREALESFHPTLAPLGERIQRITPGTSREDVRRILGAPQSKVTIPGDMSVSEIYYYQQGGRNAATVRLEAGAVTRITTDGI